VSLFELFHGSGCLPTVLEALSGPTRLAIAVELAGTTEEHAVREEPGRPCSFFAHLGSLLKSCERFAL